MKMVTYWLLGRKTPLSNKRIETRVEKIYRDNNVIVREEDELQGDSRKFPLLPNKPIATATVFANPGPSARTSPQPSTSQAYNVQAPALQELVNASDIIVTPQPPTMDTGREDLTCTAEELKEDQKGEEDRIGRPPTNVNRESDQDDFTSILSGREERCSSAERSIFGSEFSVMKAAQKSEKLSPIKHSRY